ncbi:LysM peptidoglycan-binding domain-containing protein [Natroniella sulfidigena]|uniref:LysM peptidoglycan-binding domain-containing protein n=1 Tax=Natroniella sulfidigena TaxID=723921 RepID=UPI00200A6F10|nr:LysM peptidoglycan-binding domain-containing protein [Natroniella sulfidigena]MCK8817599.1 LysM peptidoglycan-binding domain-containing protein [Natroniella sulfidigena]
MDVYKGVPDQTPEQFPIDYLHYVVQPNDTFSTIATQFGVTVEDIMLATPAIPDPNLIFPGQILRIPTVGFPDDSSEEFVGYVVQPGVLLDDIAEIVNITVDEILEINPTVIYPGRIYTIPVADVEPLPMLNFFEYIVEPGDVLAVIASRFDVTVEELILVNPQIPDHDRIFAGQILIIPRTAPPETPRPIEYVVQPGDTIVSIANQFNLTSTELINFNPAIPDPDIITAGQIIDIPT